jgi:mRNA interferase HicA
MNCAEFIKKIKAAAKVRGLSCRLDASRGKGSHATLYFGGKGDRSVALTPARKIDVVL